MGRREAESYADRVPEITAPVLLCGPDGRLNPAAVGWSRRPLHTANLRGWGRTKRWEYWGIVSADVIVGLTISSLDYAGLHSIYVLDRRTNTETVRTGIEPLARAAQLPDRSGVGVARGRAGELALEFASSPSGTRLSARAASERLAISIRIISRVSIMFLRSSLVPWAMLRPRSIMTMRVQRFSASSR